MAIALEVKGEHLNTKDGNKRKNVPRDRSTTMGIISNIKEKIELGYLKYVSRLVVIVPDRPHRTGYSMARWFPDTNITFVNLTEFKSLLSNLLKADGGN